MPKNPAAFLSYSRNEDEYSEGRITELRKRLEGEVRAYLGDKDFTIFQDRRDITWGQQWKARIEEVLDGATFFIPIVTPLFLKSTACREELERFLRREEQLGRRDLILPIYYREVGLFSDAVRLAGDPLAGALAARQFVEWRDLRHEPLDDPRVGRQLEAMAQQVLAALERPAPSAGPWQQPVEEHDPSARPTRIVDPKRPGQFTTLVAAVAAADPGDRIVVRPGRYEGVVLKIPLDIVGIGPVEEIVVGLAGEHPFVLQASKATISNLSLQGTAGAEFAVSVQRGQLELSGCMVSASHGTCVGVQAGAEAILRQNSICDGRNGGVLVLSGAHCILEDNRIIANHGLGVAIAGSATLRRNQISNGKGTGVYVYEGGQAVLEDNIIVDNKFSGISIGELGNLIARRNRISKNGHRAITIGAGGGAFHENDLRDNGLGAWAISVSSFNSVIRFNNLED